MNAIICSYWARMISSSIICLLFHYQVASAVDYGGKKLLWSESISDIIELENKRRVAGVIKDEKDKKIYSVKINNVTDIKYEFKKSGFLSKNETLSAVIISRMFELKEKNIAAKLYETIVEANINKFGQPFKTVKESNGSDTHSFFKSQNTIILTQIHFPDYADYIFIFLSLFPLENSEQKFNNNMSKSVDDIFKWLCQPSITEYASYAQNEVVNKSKYSEFKKGIYTGVTKRELSSLYNLKQSYLGGNTYDVIDPKLIDDRAQIIRVLFDHNDIAYEIMVNFGTLWNYYNLMDVLVGVYGQPNRSNSALDRVWEYEDDIIRYKRTYHQGDIYQILEYENKKISNRFKNTNSEKLSEENRTKTKNDIKNWN